MPTARFVFRWNIVTFKHFMTVLSVIAEVTDIMGSVATVIGVIVAIKRK